MPTATPSRTLTPTSVNQASPTVVADPGDAVVPLPEGLELLGSGRGITETGVVGDSASSEAYLSQDESKTLYPFFTGHLETQGWTILEACCEDRNRTDPEREISLQKGDTFVLIELWDLDNSDIAELVSSLSTFWAYDIDPRRLAQGETLVFIATLPCSPDAPMDCS
jgi:hypothetical protein